MMIKAAHKSWAETIFDPYVSHLLKKKFSHFYLVNEFPKIPLNRSLIITPNHISWWDGFFIYYLKKKKCDRKVYLMMLESSLEKFWFFKKVGAFSINPYNSKSIIESFAYSHDVLNNHNNVLVVYPQGEIESFEKRPLNLKSGLQTLIKPIENYVVTLPIGFKIEYRDKRNPALFCRFGNLVYGNSIVENFQNFTDSFYENLSLLSDAAIKQKFSDDLF